MRVNSNEWLAHHGVKGQKWGVRHYQNEDGSYKPGAEGRYDPEPQGGNRGGYSNSNSRGGYYDRPHDDAYYDDYRPQRSGMSKAAKIGVGVVGAALLAYGVYKLGARNSAVDEAVSKGTEAVKEAVKSKVEDAAKKAATDATKEVTKTAAKEVTKTAAKTAEKAVTSHYASDFAKAAVSSSSKDWYSKYSSISKTGASAVSKVLNNNVWDNDNVKWTLSVQTKSVGKKAVEALGMLGKKVASSYAMAPKMRL